MASTLVKEMKGSLKNSNNMPTLRGAAHKGKKEGKLVFKSCMRELKQGIHKLEATFGSAIKTNGKTKNVTCTRPVISKPTGFVHVGSAGPLGIDPPYVHARSIVQSSANTQQLSDGKSADANIVSDLLSEDSWPSFHTKRYFIARYDGNICEVHERSGSIRASLPVLQNNNSLFSRPIGTSSPSEPKKQSEAENIPIVVVTAPEAIVTSPASFQTLKCVEVTKASPSGAHLQLPCPCLTKVHRQYWASYNILRQFEVSVVQEQVVTDLVAPLKGEDDKTERQGDEVKLKTQEDGAASLARTTRSPKPGATDGTRRPRKAYAVRVGAASRYGRLKRLARENRRLMQSLENSQYRLAQAKDAAAADKKDKVTNRELDGLADATTSNDEHLVAALTSDLVLASPSDASPMEHASELFGQLSLRLKKYYDAQLQETFLASQEEIMRLEEESGRLKEQSKILLDDMATSREKIEGLEAENDRLKLDASDFLRVQVQDLKSEVAELRASNSKLVSDNALHVGAEVGSALMALQVEKEKLQVQIENADSRFEVASMFKKRDIQHAIGEAMDNVEHHNREFYRVALAVEEGQFAGLELQPAEFQRNEEVQEIIRRMDHRFMHDRSPFNLAEMERAVEWFHLIAKAFLELEDTVAEAFANRDKAVVISKWLGEEHEEVLNAFNKRKESFAERYRELEKRNIQIATLQADVQSRGAEVERLKASLCLVRSERDDALTAPGIQKSGFEKLRDMVHEQLPRAWSAVNELTKVNEQLIAQIRENLDARPAFLSSLVVDSNTALHAELQKLMADNCKLVELLESGPLAAVGAHFDFAEARKALIEEKERNESLSNQLEEAKDRYARDMGSFYQTDKSQIARIDALRKELRELRNFRNTFHKRGEKNDESDRQFLADIKRQLDDKDREMKCLQESHRTDDDTIEGLEKQLEDADFIHRENGELLEVNADLRTQRDNEAKLRERFERELRVGARYSDNQIADISTGIIQTFDGRPTHLAYEIAGGIASDNEEEILTERSLDTTLARIWALQTRGRAQKWQLRRHFGIRDETQAAEEPFGLAVDEDEGGAGPSSQTRRKPLWDRVREAQKKGEI